MTAKALLLNGKWEAESKPQRSCNPRGFVVTDRSEDVICNPPAELVEQFIKVAKLIYDKQNIDFNVKSGEYLYFSEDGACYLLEKVRKEGEEIL